MPSRRTWRATPSLVLDGVPDTFAPSTYLEPIGIWDVSDPAHPLILSAVNFGMSPHGAEGGDLGDKPRDARAVFGHHLFALYEKGPRPTRDFRLGVADISDPHNPVDVGDWQDDAKAALMGQAFELDTVPLPLLEPTFYPKIHLPTYFPRFRRLSRSLPRLLTFSVRFKHLLTLTWLSPAILPDRSSNHEYDRHYKSGLPAP